jgi:hypothetical protein
MYVRTRWILTPMLEGIQGTCLYWSAFDIIRRGAKGLALLSASVFGADIVECTVGQFAEVPRCRVR